MSCFKRGAQPALLTASFEGTRSPPGATLPDYKPAALEVLDAKTKVLSLPLPDAAGELPPITLVAFEARAHFDRQITAAGPLGGPACRL